MNDTYFHHGLRGSSTLYNVKSKAKICIISMCIISVHVNEYYSVSELWLHTEKCWFMFISEEVVVCPGPRSMWRIEWCTLTLQVPMQPTGLSGRPLSPSFLLMARKRYAWGRNKNTYIFRFVFFISLVFKLHIKSWTMAY